MKELLNKIEGYKAEALELIASEYTRIKPNELPITDHCKGDKWHLHNTDRTRYAVINRDDIDFYVFDFTENVIRRNNPKEHLPAYIGTEDYAHFKMGGLHNEKGPAYEAVSTNSLCKTLREAFEFERDQTVYYALDSFQVDKELIENTK